MRRIDADALKESIKIDDMPALAEALKGWIDSQQSAEKHGKWEHGREIARTMLGDDVLSIEYEDWHCSCCGRRYKEYVLPYNFCPNCGARMEMREEWEEREEEVHT